MRFLPLMGAPLGSGGGGSGGGTDPGPQTIYPIADVTVTNWTVAPIWSKVDDQSDVDTVECSASDFQLRLEFNNATDPVTHVGHSLNIRWFGASGLETVTIRLMQGAVVISTWAGQNPPPLMASTYNLAIAEAEAANITDWNDLYFDIPVGSTVSKGDQIVISGIWLDLA